MSLWSSLQRVGKPLLRSGPLLTIAALCLVLLIWILGPLLAFGEARPLDPASTRLAIILVIVLAWGIAGFFIRIRRSSADQALLAALRRQKEEEKQAAEQVRDKADVQFAAFRDSARGAMRFTNRGRRFNPYSRENYRLPWYLVMGRDGAGKTSAILNGGLAFPYQPETPADAPAVFHLADQAVLVELAGQFLEQADRASSSLWLHLLDHLRRLRPQQPISGLIITISAGELMAMTPESGLDFGSALRRRIDEITARLRTRPPVYILVTKLDLLVGFEEFFDALSTEERNAVLGFSLDPAAKAENPGLALERFTQGFSGIVGSLARNLLLRLQEEPDDQRRRRAFEFPNQFAAMQEILESLVTQVTFTHRFEAPPLVRGMFFASATQNGLSVDALSTHLARNFAQKPQNLALRAESAAPRARAYFLHKLVHDVVIPEASLGGLTRHAALMMRVRGVAVNALLALAVFAILVFWWLGFTEGRAYTARLQDEVGAARASLAAASPDGKLPSTFMPALNALDDLRKLAKEQPARATFGLYGTASVEEAARGAYDRGISALLLPFANRYLHDGLNDPKTTAALRFQQLKLYLMLTGERPVEPSTAALLGPDFSAKWLPYDRTQQIDERISEHLAELSSTVVTPPPLMDMRLVDRARGFISDYTLARLAYDSLIAMPDIQQLPPWRPVDHMGLSGPQAMSRISGSSFWDGVAGLYTKSGFLDTGLPATGTVATALGNDLWVMGVADSALDRQTEIQRIRKGMLDLYRVDYIRSWDSLLSDLTIADGTSAGEVARALAIITGNPSPVTELMQAIAAETNLAPAAGPVGADKLAGALAKAAPAQVKSVAGSVTLPQRVVDVGKAVTDHFQAFNKAVSAAEGQQSQVSAIVAALQPLYTQLNLVATGGDILELGAQPQTILNQLGEQVNALPASLQPLFRRILSQVAAVTGGSSRARLADIWKTTVLPVCQSTTEHRYPFEPKSSDDASIADFATVFAPTGLIASFRNDYLKPFIDTTTKPWRWRTGQKIGLDLSDEVLAGFERAADITDIYFGASATPAVKFTVSPVQLDLKARALQFDVGGPVLVYTHGPLTPTEFQWPPQPAGADAVLSMTPELDGERNALRRQGPWALFRLFDAGRILNPDATDVVPYGFTIGSRKAVLDVTVSAARNPFAMDTLADFKCPVL